MATIHLCKMYDYVCIYIYVYNIVTAETESS